MIEARQFIYIESVMGGAGRLYYLTDVNPEKVYCKLKDLLSAIQTEYKFKIETINDIKTKIKCGYNLIVDIVEKVVYTHDNMDKVLIREGFVKKAEPGTPQMNLEGINQAIEEYFAKHLFHK